MDGKISRATDKHTSLLAGVNPGMTEDTSPNGTVYASYSSGAGQDSVDTYLAEIHAPARQRPNAQKTDEFHTERSEIQRLAFQVERNNALKLVINGVRRLINKLLRYYDRPTKEDLLRIMIGGLERAKETFHTVQDVQDWITTATKSSRLTISNALNGEIINVDANIEISPHDHKILDSSFVDDRIPRLSRLEVERLISEIKEYKEKLHEINQKLVEQNLSLVVHIAKRFLNRGLGMADLIQAGNIGLLRAVQDFDPTISRFATYAAKWIEHYIGSELHNVGRTIRIPAHTAERIKQANRYIAVYELQYGRKPKVEEVVDTLGLSVAIAEMALEGTPEPRSIDQILDGTDDFTLQNVLSASGTDLEQLAIGKNFREVVAGLLGQLEKQNPRWAIVIAAQYGIPYGQYEGGEALSLQQIVDRELLEKKVSRERVRQIGADGMSALQKLTGSDHRDKFL